MFKEKGEVSTINKILITMLAIICVFAVVIILLTQLNKKNVETNIKEAQGMITNYATTDENTWDVSANGDGSVIATLAANGTLTISGSGQMKNWNDNATTDWHNSAIKEKVKNVVINSGIINIGEYAFYGCSNLTSINISEGVTSIDDMAFEYCSSLASINIPKGVTEIGEYAFGVCKNLINITIPSSVTNIGGGAFSQCISLTSIIIPEGVTSIKDRTFDRCESLTMIEIPSTIRSIGFEAFRECIYLTKINMPDGITSIGDGAFISCRNLISINIPASVTSIGDGVFRGCWDLTSIIVDNSNSNYTSVDGVLYNKEKTELIKYPAKKEGTKYEIIESVTSIGNWAFNDCDLNTINIPEGVIHIGEGAFESCSSLTEIKIPEGVTHIEDFTFRDCYDLKSVTISRGVTDIGACSFEDCENLTNIIIPVGVISIDETAFRYCDENKLNIICKSNSTGHTYAIENSILYTLDDKVPTITFGTNGNATVSKTQSTTVKVADSTAGVSKNNLKYLWSKSSTTPTEESFMQTFKNGSTISKKDGDGNWYLWILAKDNVGNVKIQKSGIFKLDNTVPTAQVSYSTTEPTNQKVTVTVTANEEIQVVSEWTLSTDKKVLTKEFSTNALYVMTIKDIAGNEIVKTIEISNIDKLAPKVSVSYSTTEVTNEGVEVTITANEEVQTVSGWTLSEDKKVLTKEYSENTTETITIKDIAGNERQVEVEIPNIDKTAPIASVNYSTIEQTNEGVEVTITANEEIQELSGWTLSEDKKVLTKEYTQNITETIKIKDIAGNETPVNITIANIIDKTAPTASVSYSTTAKTNQNVKVTITANEEVQAVTGWTLSTDKKVLTKEYTANKTETITIKDIAGNETQVEVKISNIDKTAPEVKVDYIQETSQRIKVIITASEEVQVVSGWTISTDKKILTKEYTQNKTETIIIKDMAGNEKTVQIKVTQIIKIKEDTYEVKENYIIGIQTKTTYENFAKNIEANSECKVTENNQEVTGKALIKTGQKLIIDDQILTLVVIGDCNGDGQANIKDILAINKHRLNKANLVDEYLQAGDINQDGKVNLRDILQINKYRLGKISEL